MYKVAIHSQVHTVPLYKVIWRNALANVARIHDIADLYFSNTSLVSSRENQSKNNMRKIKNSYSFAMVWWHVQRNTIWIKITKKKSSKASGFSVSLLALEWPHCFFWTCICKIQFNGWALASCWKPDSLEGDPSDGENNNLLASS